MTQVSFAQPSHPRKTCVLHACRHEATSGNIFMAAQKFELSNSVLAVMPGKDTSRLTAQSDANWQFALLR